MTYINFLTNGISKNYIILFIIASWLKIIYNNSEFRLSEGGFTMFKSFNQQFYRNFYFYHALVWSILTVKQFDRSPISALFLLLLPIQYYYAFFRPNYNLVKNWQLAIRIIFSTIMGCIFIFI